MENSLLIGLSRQVALRRELDVIANNIANLNTTGFKGESVLFEEYLMPVAEMDNFPRADRKLSYVQDWATVHDLKQGSVVQTGNPLDIALEGEGYFTIQTNEGEQYTRNGSFAIDLNGTLVTHEGRPVLGEGGPIGFGPDDVDIAIAQDGTISVGGEIRDRIRVVEFDNPQALERKADNLFAGTGARASEQTRVVQGAVEKSNVHPVVELTRMIEVTRTYDVVSRMVRQGDELRSKSIERLGTAPA